MHTPSLLDSPAHSLVFVYLDITCWSGKKTLTPEDLGLDRTQLPPETLVSLGDKQLIDPEALRAFTSIRSAARRYCLEVGVRFLGGYAIPAAKAQALLDRLDALGQRYGEARTAFLAHYDDRLAAWTEQQPPEWQKLIQDARAPAEYVDGRLSFAVQAVRFGAPDPAVVTHRGLNRALAGLGDRVFHEVAQLAREALERSYQGKAEVTRRALSPLAAIRDKLEGLSFMDSRFRAVVQEINRLLAGCPARRPIAGYSLSALRQFLCLAAQPDGLRTFAEQTPPSGAFWIAPSGDLAFDTGVTAGDPDEDEAAASDADDTGAESALALAPEPTASDVDEDAEREPVGVAEDGDWFF